MNNDRWGEVKAILAEVLEADGAERSSLLERLCVDDAELRQAVESLLTVEGRAQAVMDSAVALESAPVPGLQIGRYHLLQKVGEGGMGDVWLAEQRDPVRRRVALKVVKAGMNTREVMVRFESERQALALMDHPAIAKVFDAGSTAQGAPYFVMEYVAGVPVTTYCDNHRLITRERLELFMHVCEGVHHAHQKAILHRDLKPSNILVAEVDGRARPKIIDFGVAKALTQRLTANTMFTRLGAMIGTPEYMSPEQALSSGEDIDTRTDVYSLGIVLYELLVGSPPLDLRRIAFEEFLRRLREQDPPKPSTKVRTQNAATSSELARRRQTEPQVLAKQLRGDLDAIVLKALEKERSRRYSSSADLAADIGRYLNNEEVLAMVPSAGYRARKFARRHRGALVTAAAFVLVLITAAGIIIRQSIRANREAAVAQAVNDFLQKDLLAQASAANQSGPSTKPDPDLKVRTALDRAADRISGRFGQEPGVEAAVRDTIGQTYLDLGLYPEAQAQLQQALDLHRRLLGPENPKSLKTASRLAYAAYLQGKYPEAEVLARQTMDVQRRVVGPEHSDTLYSMNILGLIYAGQGKYAKAEALSQQELKIQSRVFGPEDPTTLGSMNNLALDYYREGKYADAEALYSQALEIKRRILGPEHPSTLATMSNLALDYDDEGKYPQAEALNAETLEIERHVLGPEHPNTLSTMNNLGSNYFHQGKYAEAEALYSQALEIKGRVLGPEHPSTLNSASNLANVYEGEAKFAQAEALLRRVLESRRRVLGPEHPSTLKSLSYLGQMYQRQRNYVEAAKFAAEALAGKRRALGSERDTTMESAADLALAYLSLGKFADGEPLAREAMEFDRKKQPDDWHRFSDESLLGATLAGQKEYAQAEPLLIEGYDGMIGREKRISVPDRDCLERARKWIAQLYRSWGKAQEAAQWETVSQEQGRTKR